MRACGCADDSVEPRLLYLSRTGATVRRRVQHEPCGKRWFQVETLNGEEIGSHGDG